MVLLVAVHEPVTGALHPGACVGPSDLGELGVTLAHADGDAPVDGPEESVEQCSSFRRGLTIRQEYDATIQSHLQKCFHAYAA